MNLNSSSSSFSSSSSIRRVAGCLAIVAFLSACSSKEEKSILQPTESLAPILAEETVQSAGSNRKVAIISPDSSWGPISPVEKTFRATLQKQAITIIDAKSASLGDPMRSGEVGLKSQDFIDVLEKNPNVGAIVSFAGVPLLKQQDFARIPADHAPVLVIATAMLGTAPGVPGDRSQFSQLLDSKVVQLIIVDGPDSHASSLAASGDANHKLFWENYRIARRP